MSGLAVPVVVLLAFALGAVLGGQIFGRLAGTDLKTSGSGNVGATNALRAGGVGLGLAVLTFDLGKGVVAAVLLPKLAPDIAHLGWACGAAAIAGHVYSPLAGFAGGKGAATLVGVYVGMVPLGVAINLPLFALVLVLTGYVSLAVLAAGFGMAVFVLVRDVADPLSLPVLFATLIWLFLCWTHRQNIRRLISGRENRFRRVMLFKRD